VVILKALILKEYHKLVYEDFPDPEYSPDEVLVKVKSCGICGSDVHGMDGSTGRRIPPIVMGHEASGVITEVGGNVKNWYKEDRVTFDSTIYPLNDWFTLKGMYNLSENRMVMGVSTGEYRRHGALAEYVAVPQHILYKIPDNVSFDHAAMVEPFAVAAHAVEITPVSLNDTAVVIGAGMIGLCLIQVLRAKGCGKIIAVDVDSVRLDLANDLGADISLHSKKDEIVEVIKNLTEKRGADIVFEVVGITSTIAVAISSTRKGGTVTLVGNLSPKVEFPLQSVVTRQIRLQGSCAICGEYPMVLDLMERGILNSNALLSATAPLREGAEWFRKLYNREKGLMKVILKP
jgi:threonine dehydrogenase-like Zn-dependent dehydrogenase